MRSLRFGFSKPAYIQISFHISGPQHEFDRSDQNGIARLKWLAAATRFEVALLRHGWALKAGYDEAIMLNPDGLVSECTGENIFAARRGILITPPLSAGALPGITQDSVTTIARDHGFEVQVDELSRSDLYVAEEMFVCGTAAEVSAVNSVDDRVIRCPGPMTEVIAREYAHAVRGQIDKYKEWCELV